MANVGISKSTLYSTDRMPLRDHPICSTNVTDENGERNGTTHSSGVKKSTLFIKDRVPLRYHPMFPKNLTDENDDMNGVSRESCSRSTPVLGDISNLVETCNFRRSTKTTSSNQIDFGRLKNNLIQSRHIIDAVYTDINDPLSVPRKSLKRNCTAELQDLSRNFCSDGSSFIMTEDDTDYSQIENSCIVGFGNCEEALLSDDELDDDTVTNSVRVDNLQTNDDEAEDVPFDDVNDMKNIPGYVSLGPPSVKCEFCQAYMWKEERVNKNSKHGKPIFSLCCRKGQINLPKAPPTPSYLWQLYNDPKKGPLFRKCSRMYNSMFSFTSTGGNIDHSVNNGCGPYVYRLNGQNHHVFGSLIPNDGETPKFCQLYIYDTENEVSNRMQWMDIDDNDKINSEIVEGLMKMLDYTNELVKEFRVARDRFKDSPYVDLKIVLKVCRSQSGRENNIGLSNEVAAIMVGGVEDPSASRDIILERHDRATVEVRGLRKKQTPVNDDSVDEIQAFFDGRYICGSEASYRTFGFQIHHRSISVERLSFHLPGQKNCTFRSNDSLKKVAEREKNKVSKLEAFFKLNITDPNARQFTYDQIPHKYVWNDGANKWTLRKKGFQIGRLIYTHHSSGEIWYLRLLLSKVRGCTSFESLRTVNGVLYSTYHEACKELGLLENDDEWHEVLTECSKCGFPPQIRQLFVHIIVNCQVSDVCQLWLSHCQVMGDDILIMKRRSSGNNNLNLSHEEIQFYALGGKC
ncbi:hypothetical protein POM88_004512 [Heracleum sosnowskyi]|uniref:Helitron helicase-like domain-containing protein n=1 Tax=Heracleum sosnowskyi TaxID=360622 RepID=A0AAD8JLS9_9APIA|nr:hypothetical protein POM88_004512 [Heracleum sosnowskyi]